MGDGKIRRPVAPTPPDTSPMGRVKQLLQELRKGPKSDPKTIKTLEGQIHALSVGELVQLEKDLTKVLSKDEIAKYGIDLRNLFRFAVKNKAQYKANTAWLMPIVERASTDLPKAVITTELIEEKDKTKKGIEDKLQGKVTLKTYPDGGFDFLFDGLDTTDVFWLQFNWRMLAAVYTDPKKPVYVQRRNSRPGRAYLYTTKRETPRCITDLPTPNAEFADELFDNPKPPTKCVSTFHAETYLVRGRQVFYRADLELSWDIPAKRKVDKPVWTKPVVQKVTEIRAGPRSALALQFPAWDYFPGPRIGDPVPMDDLEPLSMAKVKASTWPKAPLDRLKDPPAMPPASPAISLPSKARLSNTQTYSSIASILRPMSSC